MRKTILIALLVVVGVVRGDIINGDGNYGSSCVIWAGNGTAQTFTAED